MVKSRPFYLIIAVVVFVSLSCSKKQENTQGEVRYPGFEELHFVLYTDASTDCQSCIMKAIKLLESHVEKERQLVVYLKKSAVNKNFKKTLMESFKDRHFFFYERSLTIPHPSILLIKGKSLYMRLYIHPDEFLVNEYLEKCTHFFASIDSQ